MMLFTTTTVPPKMAGRKTTVDLEMFRRLRHEQVRRLHETVDKARATGVKNGRERDLNGRFKQTEEKAAYERAHTRTVAGGVRVPLLARSR